MRVRSLQLLGFLLKRMAVVVALTTLFWTLMTATLMLLAPIATWKY